MIHLSTRNRRLLTWTPVAALVISIAVASPALIDRFGPDHTAQTRPVAAPAGPRSFTLLGAGDTLVHPPLWAQAAEDAAVAGDTGYDFDPVFAGVRQVVSSADLALCHMEAPMGPGAPQDFRRFRAPVQLADALKKIGFDGCSTASNHSLDQGEDGVNANLATLDRAGLGHTGTARTPTEAGTDRIYEVNGAKVGHLSYGYGLNAGTAVPVGKTWMANIISFPAILAAAKKLKAAGADVVVVSMHWGIEKDHRPNTQQLNGAKLLLASPDIDLLIGHHAHVVQPVEQINGKWVFYGVGNFVARHDFPIPANKEGILPRVTFTETSGGKWRVTKAEAIPIWLSLEPRIKIINLPDAMTRMSSVDTRRRKYEAAMDRITGYLDGRHATASGLKILTSTR